MVVSRCCSVNEQPPQIDNLLGLANATAHRWAAINRTVDPDDLLGTAALALVCADRSRDPHRPLAPYATVVIRRQLKRFVDSEVGTRGPGRLGDRPPGPDPDETPESEDEDPAAARGLADEAMWGDAGEAATLAERACDTAAVADALRTLPDNLIAVVAWTVGLGVEPLTQTEIAARLGVPQQRVSQMWAEGLAAMRAQMGVS